VLSLSDEGTMGEPVRTLGVPVHTLGMRAGMPGPSAFLRLQRRVRRLRPDAIQGWMYHGNLAASFAAKVAPKQPGLAWNVRQSLYDLGNEKPLTRKVIRANRALSCRPDTIIYNSRLSRSQHERFGFANDEGVIVPSGFDLTRLRPDSENCAAVRLEFGLDAEDLVIGHVARFHPMKDHATFLRAAVEVTRRVPRARFLLAGRGVGPGNPVLSGIVPSDFMPRFTFTGERRGVSRLMQAMDVLCLSSAWGEGFPNVLGEAMACGVPCVATDIGDSADIVGESGLIVPPSDSAALAQALTELLEKRPKARRDLGGEARKQIEAHYSLEVVVDRYARLYDDLTSGAGRTLP
jgi:glycosyltransferase involved in cell wall biosynthesis